MFRMIVLPILNLSILLNIGMLQANEPGKGATTEDTLPRMIELVKQEVSKKYLGAKIDLTGSIRWIRGSVPTELGAVKVLDETPRGEVRFFVTDADTGLSSEAWTGVAAWVPALVATRRIHPGEKLSRDLFTIQPVNVAAGQAREFRGLILSPESDVSTLEARQTILEGQFLMTTAAQRSPDVRRGDAVTIQLIGDGMTLSTAGMAEEPGYLKGQVRVMTTKTKRQLVGQLTSQGVVEVKL